MKSDDPDSLLFCDIKHPSRRGHEIIADRALALFFPVFIRGDCNSDGVAGESLDDAMVLLRSIFHRRRAPQIPCRAACDVNGDGQLHLTDAIVMVLNVFLGRPNPLPPFPECGPGLLDSDQTLGCDASPTCP